MRGLEIRHGYAFAKVLRAIDPEEADELMFDVLMDAEALGHSEYQEGHDEPPALFGDVPALARAWRRGWFFKAELDEMTDCPGCNDPAASLCGIHG